MFRNIDQNGIDRSEDLMAIEDMMVVNKIRYEIEEITYSEYRARLVALQEDYTNIRKECTR